MKRDIVIAVVSSAATLFLAWIVGSSIGLFEKTISDTQVHGMARKIVDDQDYRDVLLQKMSESGHFKGKRGEVGPPGPQGVEGVSKKLSCTTTARIYGNIAECPKGYVVTGCTASNYSGPIYYKANQCEASDKETAWTQARCCMLLK